MMNNLDALYDLYTDETEEVRLRDLEGEPPLMNEHVIDYYYQASVPV